MQEVGFGWQGPAQHTLHLQHLLLHSRSHVDDVLGKEDELGEDCDDFWSLLLQQLVCEYFPDLVGGMDDGLGGGELWVPLYLFLVGKL